MGEFIYLSRWLKCVLPFHAISVFFENLQEHQGRRANEESEARKAIRAMAEVL